MARIGMAPMLGWLLAGTLPLGAATYREKPFVIDNWTSAPAKVWVEERLPDGQPHQFFVVIKPGKGNGFTLAKNDPGCQLVRLRVDGSANWYAAADMTDPVSGRKFGRNIDVPWHGVVGPGGNEIKTFPNTYGKGRP